MSSGDESRSVAGNAAWMVAANVVAKLASFVLVVALARALGARQYGYFTFALAFVPLFLQLARWGLDLVTIRELAANRGALSKAFVNGLVARSSLAILGAGLAIGLSPLLVGAGLPFLVVAVVGTALLLDELSMFLGAVFIAFERMRFNAMILVVNRVLSTALTVVVLALGGSLALVCVTYLVGSVGALASAWVAFTRFLPDVHRRDYAPAEVTRLLRQGATYGVADFFNYGVFRVDSVLLQAIKGPFAVGMYGVAYRFFEPLLFATWSLSDAALPRMVREREQGRQSRTFESCLAALLAFHLPIAVAAPFTARWLTHLVFGRQYDPAVPAVLWLASGACLYAVAHLARMASVAAGRRSAILAVAAAMLAANVLANVAVVPRHGFVGAAAVTFLTEAAEAVALLWLYLRVARRFDVRPVLVPLVAAGVMAVVMAALDWRGLAAAVLGMVVYAAALDGAAFVLLGDDTRRVLRRLRPSRLAA